jgi:hypothetical protein
VHYLVAADLMILNDLGLETPTETLALANRKPSTQIFKLGEHTIAPQNIRERAGEKTFAD